MASPSVEYLRNMFQILPQGHDKALKQAFYNTAANLFVIFACAAAVAVYFVLEAFLKPLLWAVLCGSFLYPLKRSLTNRLRGWLTGLNTSNTPFIVGVAILPFSVVNKTSDSIYNTLVTHYKLILSIIFGVPLSYLLYQFGPLHTIFAWIHSVFGFVYEVLGYFSSIWLWTIVIAYLFVVIFYWTPRSSLYLRYLSVPVWMSIVLHVASIAGALRVPLFIAMTTLMVIGFVTEVRNARQQSKEAGTDPGNLSPTAVSAAWAMFTSSTTTCSDASDTSPTSESEASPGEMTKSNEPTTPLEQSSKPTSLLVQDPTAGQKGGTPHGVADRKEDVQKAPSLSDNCFRLLFWAILLVQFWMHMWIIQQLMVIPLALLLVKKLVGSQLSGITFVREKTKLMKERLYQWIYERREVLMPRALRGLLKMLMRGDKKIVSILEQSLDKATSVLLILMLLVGTVLFSVIFVIQVQQESMHLVKVTSNLFNESDHPIISQYLPNSDDMQKAISSMVENAYLYGRHWIAAKIHDLVSGDGANNTHLERQVLDLWDGVYEGWFAKNTTAISGHMYPVTPGFANLTSLWDLASIGDGFNIGDAVDFVKTNIGTFMSVLESVWVVLKGNLNLVFSLATTMISLVFGGGTALLNFVISAVIFLTTMFYLLASSGNQYKPVEWFSSMIPAQSVSGGNRFGQAVEEAIAGVFMASLKMAVFYGLYTWLTHTVFGVNIVVLPSAIAAICAAIPFLGTYWAAVPAILELWLVHSEGIKAILLAVCHLLPTYIVDTAIYSEIKGGHPFMTGLAIAGGIFCFGLEGAIIGPMLLCFLVVAINMYGTMLKPDVSTPGGGVAVNSVRSHGLKAEKRVSWNLPRSLSSDQI